MANFTQIRVHRDGNDLPLILTFTNAKEASGFQTWLIINKRKFDVIGPGKVFRTEAEAVEELAFWER